MNDVVGWEDTQDRIFFGCQNMKYGQQNRRGCIAPAGLTNQLAVRFEAKSFNVLGRFMEVLRAAYHLNIGGVERRRQAFNRALEQGVFTNKIYQLFGIQLSGNRPQSGTASPRQQNRINGQVFINDVVLGDVTDGASEKIVVGVQVVAVAADPDGEADRLADGQLELPGECGGQWW